jgi:hypothetical protein
VLFVCFDGVGVLAVECVVVSAGIVVDCNVVSNDVVTGDAVNLVVDALGR